jgi:hypothetical protein
MYLIIINEVEYYIQSIQKYNYLLTNFIKYIFLDKSKKSTTNKFSIIFKNNNKNDIYISLTNREYIIELLEDINKINSNIS